MASRTPRIGITTLGRDRKDGELRLTVDYVDAVRRAGGLALLLPPGELDVDAILGACDGVVLSGGGDIDPVLHGGRRHPQTYGVDRARDDSEIALARAIVARRFPALCICRGVQVLAVAHGGTLVEHIPDEHGERVRHRGDGRYHENAVSVVPGSRLHEILGAAQPHGPCWHHQSVRDPGRGLRVVARAADGVVEALEHEHHPALLAVQWHPEHSAARDQVQQRLFDALVRSAVRG